MCGMLCSVVITGCRSSGVGYSDWLAISVIAVPFAVHDTVRSFIVANDELKVCRAACCGADGTIDYSCFIVVGVFVFAQFQLMERETNLSEACEKLISEYEMR